MQTDSSAILSTAYLPPVQYISKFLIFDAVVLELHENYQKQSYRNRCIIYAANGPLTLVIPVKKKQGEKTGIKDIKIDYDMKWQKLHWKSIVSAYRNSPFFDFYEDDFYPFYSKKETFLFEYNFRLLGLLLKLLNIDNNFKTSASYVEGMVMSDYRESLNPKKRLAKPDLLFQPASYPQVFKEKHGFIPNLSIIDLLFNAGPDSKSILFQSIKRGCVKSHLKHLIARDARPKQSHE